MNTKIKMFFSALLFAFGVFAVSSVFVPTEVFAQAGAIGDGAQGGLTDIKEAFPENTTDEVNVGDVAKKIIDWALYLAAIVAVIFIIYGGFLYITSAGDQTQAGKGRNTLVNALIGLVIIVLSYMIVQAVYNFLVS